MAASTQLIRYLQSLGLTQAQIDALLAQAAGDANMDENAIADAARRMMQGGGGIPAPGVTTTVTPPAGTTPGGATPGGETAPLPPGMVDIGYGAEYGLPTSYLPTAVGVQDYNAAVATGLLAGNFTPYQWAASGRGQNPNNLPSSMNGGAGDGSPEARLPGMQYAGTVMASTLTPEQAASIQYNTPEYQAWLATQPTGTMELSANVLNNALLGGAYAGSQADLEASIVASHQEQWRRLQAVNPNITWEMYVRQVTPQVRDTLERATGLPTTTGAPSDPNQRGPQAGFYTGGTTAPLVSTPSMAQTDRNTVLANAIAQNQQYISTLSAIPEAQRTPAQQASLQAAQDRMAAQQAEQAAMRTTLVPGGGGAPVPSQSGYPTAPAPPPAQPAPAPPPVSQPAPAAAYQPMTQTPEGTYQLAPGTPTGSASLGVPPPAPPPAPVTATPAPAPVTAPRPTPPPGFIETNMRYESEILAIPPEKRTAAQKASLAAAQQKLAPYR